MSTGKYARARGLTVANPHSNPIDRLAELFGLGAAELASHRSADIALVAQGFVDAWQAEREFLVTLGVIHHLQPASPAWCAFCGAPNNPDSLQAAACVTCDRPGVAHDDDEYCEIRYAASDRDGGWL
jgi:hypothetical protein